RPGARPSRRSDWNLAMSLSSPAAAAMVTWQARLCTGESGGRVVRVQALLSSSAASNAAADIVLITPPSSSDYYGRRGGVRCRVHRLVGRSLADSQQCRAGVLRDHMRLQ